MALAHSPKIITDGLVLCLDAGNTKSYPGSGTTWTDLSGNGNTGTLTNGVGYSGDNLGSLSFDGVNDYVNVGNVQTYFPGPIISGAIDFWIKPGVINANDIYIGMQNPYGNRIYIGNYLGLWDVGFGSFAWNGGFIGTRQSVTLSWTNVCLNITSGSAKLYINGIETITKTTDTTVSMTGVFPIGGYLFEGTFDNTNMGSSNISSVKIYNRALTASEIQQNFNATRSRYGI